MFGGNLEDGSPSGCADMQEGDTAVSIHYEYLAENLIELNPPETSRSYSSIRNNDSDWAQSMLDSSKCWLTSDTTETYPANTYWAKIDVGSEL
jgi:hypothetical protein